MRLQVCSGSRLVSNEDEANDTRDQQRSHDHVGVPGWDQWAGPVGH